MIPGSMSCEPFHGSPAPRSESLQRDPQVTSRRLAQDLQEVRARAAAMFEEITDGLNRAVVDVGPEGESAPHGTMDEIHDDDLGLKEKLDKCSDLRASLVRQWAEAHSIPSPADVTDLIQFNEAIDRSLLESIARARAHARKTREMFLAVLGHDLRTPLGAVVMASEYLVARGELTERDLRLASRIRSSGQRMADLVNDLLEFTRCRLGEGIPISPGQTSLGAIGREVVEEVRAAHPERELRFETRGEVRGSWDAGRLWQALCNLVENAVLHGEGAPVLVTVLGGENEVVTSVHNAGSAISDEDQRRIFDPFEHCAKSDKGRRFGSGLGLGLYIAREIAVAHGGSITVSSSAEDGTTFDLRLPRAT